MTQPYVGDPKLDVSKDAGAQWQAQGGSEGDAWGRTLPRARGALPPESQQTGGRVSCDNGDRWRRGPSTVQTPGGHPTRSGSPETQRSSLAEEP